MTRRPKSKVVTTFGFRLSTSASAEFQAVIFAEYSVSTESPIPVFCRPLANRCRLCS